MSKLTLHVPAELVSAAKNEAASRRVSVSKLVSDYFACLAANQPGSAKDAGHGLAPKTSRLAGCIPDADTEDYIDYSLVIYSPAQFLAALKQKLESA